MKIQYFFIFPFFEILRELLLPSPVPHGAAPVGEICHFIMATVNMAANSFYTIYHVLQ